MSRIQVKKMVLSALMLALCLVLPFLTGQIPQVGRMLLPMHIPVLLCGFICGWPWALAVGFVAPILRSTIFTMPMMFPDAVSMAFELAVYGFVTGIFYEKLPKTKGNTVLSLIAAMVCGRIVWGVVRLTLTGPLRNRIFLGHVCGRRCNNGCSGVDFADCSHSADCVCL